MDEGSAGATYWRFFCRQIWESRDIKFSGYSPLLISSYSQAVALI